MFWRVKNHRWKICQVYKPHIHVLSSPQQLTQILSQPFPQDTSQQTVWANSFPTGRIHKFTPLPRVHTLTNVCPSQYLDTMKISAIVALAAVIAVAQAQTCWTQLKDCKTQALDKEIDLGQCREELTNSGEETRCWKCAYTEVQRCVDASGGGYWSTCYKNGLRMRKFCLEGKPCGYERPGELNLRFQRD